MSDEFLADRALLEIRGEDARNFLQGLVTNDISQLSPISALYAALLTPQGKIVCDFFLYESGLSVLLDCARSRAADLQRRLSRYRLRARLEIVPREEWKIVAGTNRGQADEHAWTDPRHTALGWRKLRHGDAAACLPMNAYHERRLDLGIPEGDDFGSERMFALDADLEELHAVSFDKGCYVGQELTARMKHRGTARKKVVPIVASASRLPPPETAVTALDREIGSVIATYGARGFAVVRIDRLEEAGTQPLSASGIPLNLIKPDWLFS